MALSAQALTLAQYAVTSNNSLVSGITMSLIDNGSVMARDIPFVNKKTMIANGVRWEGSLPTVGWRQINAGTTVTSGTPKPFQEQAYVVSNAIDVDRILVEYQNAIQDPRSLQLAAYLKSLAYDFNDKFINNDPVAGNADSITGIKYRIANGNIFGVRPENSIDAGGTVLTQAGMTVLTANVFIEQIDQLLWSVGAPDGQGVVLYMNDIMKRRFAFAIRLMGINGGFSITQDQFGRTVESYRGAVVRDIGYKADQATRIISNTETATGANGASNYTSIYAVHYGSEWIYGWQYEPLQGKDLGLIGNDGTAYRILVDWVCGLYGAHTRAMARLYDLKLT